MDLGLKGSVALITGASKGIGKAIALQFSKEDCRVAVVARGKDKLEDAAKDIRDQTGNEVISLPGDMSVTEDTERVIKEAIDHFGKIDIAVPNAGSAPGGLVEELTDEDWFSALNLKFMGYVRTARAILPYMVEQRKGSIVMVVGNDGLKPPFYEIAPGACNAADHNFASSLAEQYGSRGIRVNTVNPGPVNTDRWDWIEQSFAKAKGITQEKARKLVLGTLPPGRIATPEEIANVVVFLSSDRAGFVNGAHVPVDGAQRKALMDADLVKF